MLWIDKYLMETSQPDASRPATPLPEDDEFYEASASAEAGPAYIAPGSDAAPSEACDASCAPFRMMGGCTYTATDSIVGSPHSSTMPPDTPQQSQPGGPQPVARHTFVSMQSWRSTVSQSGDGLPVLCSLAQPSIDQPVGSPPGSHSHWHDCNDASAAGAAYEAASNDDVATDDGGAVRPVQGSKQVSLMAQKRASANDQFCSYDAPDSSLALDAC